MATNGNAWAQQSDTHSGEVLRGFAAAVFNLPMASHANSTTAPTTRLGASGVVGPPTALEATITSGLNWSVNEGYVVAAGTFAKGQGCYVGYNNGAVTGTLAAHSAFIRHDLICYRVRDTDVDATTFEDDSIVVLQGASASTDPSIAASVGTLVPLARFVVPATSGVVTVTNLRQRAVAVGGILPCTAATRPTTNALFDGRFIYETDTDRVRVNKSATTTADWQLVDGRMGTTLVQLGQSIGSGATSAINWDVELEDTDGFHSGSSSNLTIAETGTYAVSFNVSPGLAVSSACDVVLYVGASATVTSYIPASKAVASGEVTLPLGAGDVVSLQVYNGHSSSASFSGTLRAYRVNA